MGTGGENCFQKVSDGSMATRAGVGAGLSSSSTLTGRADRRSAAVVLVELLLEVARPADRFCNWWRVMERLRFRCFFEEIMGEGEDWEETEEEEEAEGDEGRRRRREVWRWWMFRFCCNKGWAAGNAADGGVSVGSGASGPLRDCAASGGGVTWPSAVSAASSIAVATLRLDTRLDVSTYMAACTCCDMDSACWADTGDRPTLASAEMTAASVRMSDWQPTSRTGVVGACSRSSGTQWLMALKRLAGSLIL
jgi:hypothetical protein